MFPDLTRDDVFRLETRRLWLRWPRRADAVALVRLAGEKAVAEMTAVVPHPYAPEDADAFVLAARRENTEGLSLTMAMARRAQPGTLIGTVRIGMGDERQAKLGFWIGTPFWGEGLATEAARAMIDAFFAYSDGQALAASARVVNPGSRRVLEKCGFAPIGSGLQAFPARGGVLPVDHFRLDRRKWQGLKSWSASDHGPHRAGDGDPGTALQ